MEPSERLVRRDQHADLESLADQAVDEVEEAGQPLSCPFLGVCGEQLVAVLQDKEPSLVDCVIVFVVEEHVHEVAGVATEELLGVEDVLEAEPPSSSAQSPHLPHSSWRPSANCRFPGVRSDLPRRASSHLATAS